MRRHVLFVVTTSGTVQLKAARRHATDAANGVDIIITTSVLVTVVTYTHTQLPCQPHLSVRPHTCSICVLLFPANSLKLAFACVRTATIQSANRLFTDAPPYVHTITVILCYVGYFNVKMLKICIFIKIRLSKTT